MLSQVPTPIFSENENWNGSPLTTNLKQHNVSDATGGTSISTGAIVGIAVGGAVLVLVLAGVAVYAFMQKKRAEKAIELSKPFGKVPKKTFQGNTKC